MTELSAGAAPPRWGAAGWVFVAAAFVVGFVNFPLQAVGSEFDHVPGDLIDNRMNLCVLEHGYQYLTGKVERFWDVGHFYPVAGVTAWSDAHIGMLPVYAALRAGGLSPERAFQGWFLIPFVLNFAAAAWAARRVGLGPVGAGAAAFVFAYGMPLAAQGAHSQLVPRFLVPLAVAFAWEWLREPRDVWRVAAVAACGVYQTFLSVYIGYLLGLLLAAGFVSALVLSRARLRWDDLLRPGWRAWAGRLAVVAGAAAALAPLAGAHIRNGGETARDYVHGLAPRPLAWITPPGMSANYQALARYTGLGSATEGGGEEQLFPGVLPFAALAFGLMLAAVVFVRRTPLGEYSFAVAVGACASLLLAALVTKYGAHGETWFYEPLLRVPGASGVRAISRVVLVLLFPLGLALGALLDVLVRRAGRLSPAVAVVALAAVAADQRLVDVTGERKDDWWWARTPVSECEKRHKRIAAAVGAHPNPKLVYAFPGVADWLGPGGPAALQLDTMRAAQELGLPTANGWSGHFPVGWGYPRTYRALLAFLDAYDVSPDARAGLVVVGEPEPDADAAFEAAMRAAFPPRPVPGAP